MIQMLLIGFLVCFSVPLAARRIIKAFPSDVGTSLALAIKPRKITINRRLAQRYATLYKQLFLLCIVYGLLGASFLVVLTMETGTDVVWMSIFLWLSLTLAEVDRRVMLLPDILTSPMLILGFAYACFSPGLISPFESAGGAVFGYFVPMLGSFIMRFFKPDSLGGGDVKILAAFGAWLGIYYLAISILISFFIFLAIAIIKKEKAGPFGPSIAIASIIALALNKNGIIPELLVW